MAARALSVTATTRNVVVVGASAGGVQALTRLVAALPPDLDAAVCVVLHLAPTSPSALPAILQRAGHLPCRAAEDGARLHPGEILVAPPDHHLMIEDGRVRLTVGPRENGHRPSVDVLFRSAAEARDGHVVGVILSGTRDDGTAGLAVVKANGGAAIVQAPEDALYPGMPSSALANVPVDAVASAEEIGRTIAAIVRGEGVLVNARGADPNVGDEADSPLTSVCPECGGVLTETAEAGVPQWECHVGHRYSVTTMNEAQAAGVEAALWTAVRALRDRGALLERMASHAEARGQQRSVRHFRKQAQDARAEAEVVLGALHNAAANALRTDEVDDKASETAATGTI